ncbi:MAG TPA: hypothetical protein VH853_13880 [Polyangia bacterium]|jgi:hypothetical protein|nr:hypothetical protein [Polyangia bacterium]
MQLKFAASAAIALLIATGATPSRAEKKKKSTDNTEVSSNVNKQFEWENKVVGPKEGIDKDHLAAVQEQGRREEAQRKKEPPKKQGRAAGVDAAGSATLPTMDIEKAAVAPAKKQKKVAAAEPRHKDSLDSLLESNGVKGDNPSGGKTGDDGLGSILASDSGAKKSSKKHRR